MASKKSKILAMALCASVMAGIYASPVMAADLPVKLDGQGIVAIEDVSPGITEQHEVTGTLTITESALTTALAGTDVTLDSVTANTISTTGNTSVGGNLTTTGNTVVGGTLTATGNTSVGGNLTATGNTSVGGTLTATGAANLNGGLSVNGETTLANTTVNGTLNAGATTVDSLTVSGDITAGGGTIGDVTMSDGNINTDGVINAGGGTIGDVTMSDGNINTDGVINAGGGTIGDVTMSDGNINTDGVINAGGGTIGNATFSEDNTIFGTGDNRTTINNDGVTVGGEEGTSIKHDEISVGDGGYIGGGDVVSGEGVSLNQTAERVGELEDRIDKVGAMAAAIANLRTMGYDPAAPTEVAVGIGQYRDETGAALGLFHYPNRDFMLSLSVSTSGDEVMGGIGATWKFGRKSPEKVAEIKKAQAEADARRAEEAKLAKAEEMKQAAKEAKIKAQQERHAKLAAERAAQAEAAK